jgi:hypothetical protein
MGTRSGNRRGRTIGKRPGGRRTFHTRTLFPKRERSAPTSSGRTRSRAWRREIELEAGDQLVAPVATRHPPEIARGLGSFKWEVPAGVSFAELTHEQREALLARVAARRLELEAGDVDENGNSA